MLTRREAIIVSIALASVTISGCGNSSTSSNNPPSPNPPVPPTPTFNTIGYCGGMNALCYSIDGINWIMGEYDSPLMTWVSSVSAINAQYAFAVAGTKLGGVVYKTIDGGKNWNKSESAPPTMLNSIKAINKDLAWVCGDIGVIAITKDGGNSWNEFKNLPFNPDEPPRFIALDALDEFRMWSVGNDYFNNAFGVYTIDGGISWQTINTSSMTAEKPLLAISVGMDNSIWVGQEAPSDNGIYLSTDNGSSFNGVHDDTLADCFSLVSFNALSAYAGFENSQFETTINSGAHWSTQNINGRMSIYSLSVIGSNIWAAGVYPDGDEKEGYGAILYSNDSGTTWKIITPDNFAQVYSISMVQSNL